MEEIGICDKCKEPVMDTDARYAAGEPDYFRHAKCHDWRPMKEKIAEMRGALHRARLLPRRP